MSKGLTPALSQTGFVRTVTATKKKVEKRNIRICKTTKNLNLMPKKKQGTLGRGLAPKHLVSRYTRGKS